MPDSAPDAAAPSPLLNAQDRTGAAAPSSARLAVVTGASSGIGAATARRLRADGWDVVAVARRAERLQALARETGAVPFSADVTNDDDIAALVDFVAARGGLDTLVNIAGGARGADQVGAAEQEDWDWMYQVNVIGTMKMIRAFLPALRSSGEGTVLNLTSTAGFAAYEGGSGYNAAKFAQHALTAALRLEEAENNLRVIEVAPGMVHTEEFTLNRLGGNKAAAEKVYDGVEKPLTADDVARVVAYSLNLPHHINLDQIVIRPVAQAANHKLIRRPAQK
ncbi:SDR family oxidoreductase [Paenarthrobacter sp. Z7-10]|uniref:SDR family oxidoreductase n=1 Tax=Paenarthrobacter sp. Z7-10 TaxID=2787635 RepID=UPI0022A91D1A|nr:SDR family oxidoreductase [Paenarthrobacter sp. Z7-10]MCZ2403948.1 SDR family oxidoreductase [Paenarthrobacter sp. Z7-10]